MDFIFSDGSDLQVHDLATLLCTIISQSLDHYSCEYYLLIDDFYEETFSQSICLQLFVYNDISNKYLQNNFDFIF